MEGGRGQGECNLFSGRTVPWITYNFNLSSLEKLVTFVAPKLSKRNCGSYKTDGSSYTIIAVIRRLKQFFLWFCVGLIVKLEDSEKLWDFFFFFWWVTKNLLAGKDLRNCLVKSLILHMKELRVSQGIKSYRRLSQTTFTTHFIILFSCKALLWMAISSVKLYVHQRTRDCLSVSAYPPAPPSTLHGCEGKEWVIFPSLPSRCWQRIPKLECRWI